MQITQAGLTVRCTAWGKVYGIQLLTVPKMPEPIVSKNVPYLIYEIKSWYIFRFVIFYIKDEKSIVVEAVGKIRYQ